MKTKTALLACIIMLAVLTIGAVSAGDNATSNDMTADETPQDNIVGLQTDDLISEDAQGQNASKISDYTYDINCPEYAHPDWVWKIGIEKMPKDASGNISIFIDGDEKYSQPVSVRENALVVNDLNLDWGIHEACIKYSGDDKYEGFAETRQFEYTYVFLEIKDEVIEGSLIDITVDNGVTGTVKVLIDGKTVFNQKYTGTNYGGYFYADKLSYGMHTYELRYSGNYKSITKKGSFNLTYYFTAEDIDCGRIKSEYQIRTGESLEFGVVLPENAKSNFTVKINNRTYSFKPRTEETKISLSEFDIGENNVTFSYSDSKHPLKTLATRVMVLPDLTVPETVSYEGSDKVILKMPDSYMGNLTIRVDGKNYKTSKLEGGICEITLDNLTIAEHVLSVDYEGDFSQLIPQENFTVSVVPRIDVASKMWVGTDNYITFTASEDFNGNLTLKGPADETVPVVNGSAKVLLTNLKEGNNVITAIYANYTWEINVAVFNESHDWDMKIDYPTIVHTDDWWDDWEDTFKYTLLIVNYPETMMGNFTIYHDGKYVATINILSYPEDLGVVEPIFSKIGKHTIDVYYSGDGYFRPANATHVYEVTPFRCTIVDRKVIVALPTDSTGTITVNVDGKKAKSKKVSKINDIGPATYSFTLSDLKYGSTHNIEVIYSGNYGKFTQKQTVTVTKYYELYITAEDVYAYGTGNDIQFTMLPDDAKKRAVVKIDGAEYKYVTKKYSYSNERYNSINISDIAPGLHTVEVTYPGDANYAKKSVNATFSVISKISYPSSGYVNYMSSKIVSLNLPKDAAGNLVVEILNNQTGEYEVYDNVSLSNSKASIALPTSKVGEYYYRTYFTGNYDVDEVESFLLVTPIFKYDKTINYQTGGKITIEMDNKTQAVVHVSTDDFRIPLSDFKVNSSSNVITIDKTLLERAKSAIEYNERCGDYGLTIIGEFYPDGEDAIYDIYINVKFTPQIKTSNVVMNYLDGETFTVKATDIFGKTASGRFIYIEIGSTTYKVKTNKNGVATLKLTQTPGKYTVKTTFQGKTVKNTLTVKQVLTLKTVKVKKSAKKLTLQATLKNGKTPIKSKQVTFKFNGKTYKAKTNSKGVAKVTVTSSILKKLKVGKKVTYQATYSKDTVKKTAKVKK